MNLEFTNPVALVLLLLIPAAVYLARNSLANLSRARSRASLAARLAILLLVVMALAGLRIRTESRDLAMIFLVDVSASVGPEQQQDVLAIINREIERAAPGDYIGVIAFGREPSVELAPTTKEMLGEWRIVEISSNPPRDYTDVAAALRLAAAIVPETAAGRFVLLSDGNENLESAAEEAALLRAEGIEIYTRALATTSERGRAQSEMAVRDLAAPEMLAEGEAFDLKVTIDSTVDTDATLRIFRNDSLVAERDVRLASSGENVFIVPQRNDQRGFYTYRAEIEAIGSDSFVQNNSRESFTIVEGRPRTLYVSGDAQPSPAITRVLAEGNFDTEIRGPGGMPSALAGFQHYDLVIFDNVPASALTPGQMKMVQSYVRDLGGGFIMIGGDQSFGPGGYYKTPVEETLPVSLDVRQKKHFPSLAIVLVIDKSGSMSGTKMQLALEAGSATVDFLSERDSVGVLAFDDEAVPVVQLKKVEDKKAIINEINAIQPIGGTNMYPGLKQAYEWLSASDAQIKHVIVLSDGQSQDGDFGGIARSIRDAGMTLSSVAVGEDADVETMQYISDIGGGRFYATESAESLPRIFTREAFLASRSTIIEEPFMPRLVRPAQATGGIDWSAAPQLGGYVGTAERDQLNSPAITSLVTDKDDPLYAVWQYGIGRSAAFTSDAKPRWASGWMNWPGFGQFWTQAFRDTLRREGSGELSPRVVIEAGRGHIAVEAVSPDGQFKNNLRLRAHVVAPDLSTTDIALEQTAAGRYEAGFPATSRGAYLVSVIEEGGSSAPVTGAVNSYSPEFSITSADTNLLERLSEATGGRVMAIGGDAEGAIDLFERRATKTRPHEIWETLLMLALILLPADVGIRRVHITREQVERAGAWVANRLRRPGVVEVDAESAEALAQLKGARSRVRLGEATASVTEENSATIHEPSIVSIKSAERKQPVRDSKPTGVGAAAETREATPLASRLLDARRKRRD
ncbi:MAG TPA: VWA domain-containing protein [Blastocatellia bacterium]|nr:VWA domain-containing protein [Blastocatellia bacterium]